jgi:short chain dehydrogenase
MITKVLSLRYIEDLLGFDFFSLTAYDLPNSPKLRSNRFISARRHQYYLPVLSTLNKHIYNSTLPINNQFLPRLLAKMHLFCLEGKTALVTGASRGIGQSMATGLAEAGADIVLIQVSISPLNSIETSRS